MKLPIICFIVLILAINSARIIAAGESTKILPSTASSMIVDLSNGTKTELVHIPAGEFLMGATCCERGRYGNPGSELPQHRVRITNDFYLGKYECTVGEFRDFEETTGYTKADRLKPEDPDWRHPGEHDDKSGGLRQGLKAYASTDRHPVVWLRREDTKAFAKWLTDRYAPAGWEFRLPTEAEWEYACRAGTTTKYCFGDWLTPEMANVNESKFGHPVPVGSYAPNPWGLYDMHGNVYEFCLDEVRSEFFYAFSPVDNPVCDAGFLFDVCRGFECTLNYAEHRERPLDRGWGWLHNGPGDTYIGPPFRGGCFCEGGASDVFCRSATRRSDGGPGVRSDWLGFRIALCRINSLNHLPQTTDEGLKPIAPKNFYTAHPPKEVTIELEGGAWLGKHRFSAEAVSRIRIPFCGPIQGAKCDMAWIAPGEFLMSATRNEPAIGKDEKLQQRIKITKGFYLAKYEISVGEYRAFVKAIRYQQMQKNPRNPALVKNLQKACYPSITFQFDLNTWQNPGFKQSETEPVVCVSWDDAQEYIKWLNEHHAPAGWAFRLPTEAEWEYSCRAGTKTAFCFGNILTPDQANIGDVKKQTVVVGNYPSNVWGIYDMHGNAAEWVEDQYPFDKTTGEGVCHAICGGGWSDQASDCRSDMRRGGRSSLRCNTVGFRVVLAPNSIPEDKVHSKSVSSKHPAALVMDPHLHRAKLLQDLHLVSWSANDALSAIKQNKGVSIVDATPANLALLANNPKQVQRFAEKGGWLVLWGLTPEGLMSFNKIVSVEHLIRPFRHESVEFRQPEDPLLETGKVAGPYKLWLGDVQLAGGATVPKGAAEYYGSDDTFTYIVDYDDVAPFCKIPEWKYFYPDRIGPSPDNNPLNLVNGFTGVDDWKYCFVLYTRTSKLEFDMELPREETPVQLEIVPSSVSYILTKIELTYDGDAQHVQTLNLNSQGGRQSLKLSPCKVKVIHVKLAEWQNPKGGGVKNPEGAIGIDNLWLRVERTAEFRAKVKPFLNIGGLVKYPRGKGGIILCQLNIPEKEVVPENRVKREALLGALLNNIGAKFDMPVIIGE